jgi:AcrR family transcriptional regulator
MTRPPVSRRERQAAETRRDIVAAGRRLFAQQGYAKTSVVQIAHEAGVSVQTIYDSVGSKAAIVRMLIDLIDAESGVPELVSEFTPAARPRNVIATAVRISRNICERCDDVLTALVTSAPTEPEMAAAMAEGQRRHREGIRQTVGLVVKPQVLARGVSVAHAVDLVSAMTEPAVVRTFVKDYGWSFDKWEKWTVATLCDLVLKPA